MKKLFLLSALVLIGFAASAQFKFGVKAGANISTVTKVEGSMLFGAHSGLMGQYRFAENFGVQGEALFSMQGSKDVPMVKDGETIKNNLKLNYINIPVLFQYYFAQGFNVELGPQLGILLSAKWGDEDIKDSGKYKTIDFGVAAGLAYELEALPLGFFGRYTLGLTGITEGSSDAKNNVIQLGAFFKF